MFKMAFSLIFTSSPLEQFFVFPRTCFGFSNATFMFCIVAVFIVSVFELNKNTFDFSVLDYFVRSTLVLQKTILSENLNITKLIYFPYYYLLFFFILVANVFGMVPYAYTITSVFHAILYLSVTTMGGITIVGCVANGFKVVGVFLPSGASLLMLPLLMVIEIISYFARVLSLAIRLFANMLSGHVLLKISGGVVWYLL
jgi:ATP synthase subunit 6